MSQAISINHKVTLLNRKAVCHQEIVCGLKGYRIHQEDRYRSMPDILQNTLFFRENTCSICYKCGEGIKAIWNHIQDHHCDCSSRIDFKLRIDIDHFKLILKSYNSHRGRAQLQSLSVTTSLLIEVVQKNKILVEQPGNFNHNTSEGHNSHE